MGSWTTDYQLEDPMLGSQKSANMPRINYVVKSIQTELNHNGASPPLDVDGIFGPLTQAAVVHYQKMKLLLADGVVGPETARSLCQLRCSGIEAQLGLPIKGVLAGLIRVESSYDFGATGWVDPHDRGLAQINSVAHPTVTDAQAFDSAYSIMWAGRDLQGAFKLFPDIECAIASYNLGTNGAILWCVNKTSNPQVEAYVANVLKGP